MPPDAGRTARTRVPKRSFGPDQRQVSSIGQGTWHIEEGDRTSAIAALRCGLDLGMTQIDTAEMYGSGAAEELVGEAIAGRRDEVFLVSKVMPQNASRRGTKLACERSLSRLNTDRLDCYLLHWRGPHPLEDTFAALAELRDEGKILSYGVSNFDVPDLEEAWETAGGSSIVCNQVLYHLQERAIEHAVLPWCEQHQLGVTAYSPFGHGDFPATNTPGGRLLAEIARAHEATTRQVALAFLTRQPSVFVIPKASSIAHAEENAGAAGLHLSQGEIARLDAAFPRGQRPRQLPMI